MDVARARTGRARGRCCVIASDQCLVSSEAEIQAIHGLGETIDAGPHTVPDPVLVRGDVDHGAASFGGGHRVVALLVGEDDQPIAHFSRHVGVHPSKIMSG